jgi:hypothetical protein
MVDDRTDSRELNVRQLLPWTEIFRGFQVAIDPKKLLLAAVGILIMSLGWWVLSLPYQNAKKPELSDYPQDQYTKKYGNEKAEAQRQKDLKEDLARWELMHKATGMRDKQDYLVAPLSAMPWNEDRGPNPFLLATGQAGQVWEKGHFWDWFLTNEVPVLIEPLRKFLLPLIYFFTGDKGFWNGVYFLAVILWTLAVWALFGGAITRMAVVEVARKEKVGLFEALAYARNRFRSYLTAPLFPLAFLAVLTFLMILFGLFFLIPVLGDLWAGLWMLPLLGALAMALVLVGLVGWPLMSATVSAEGADSWEAVSRSYSYIYQAPWQFVWYGVVALVYGAVVIFFVGFMGSLAVYLSKWGVSQTPLVQTVDRDPAYLFLWAPRSFGWQTLLLDRVDVEVKAGDKVEIRPLVVERKDGDRTIREVDGVALAEYQKTFKWYNYIGVALVTFWVYLIFFMVLGFGYSYFWSAGSIIYLLLRKNVDDAELDEVYLEEEEQETMYREPAPSAKPAAEAPPAPSPIQIGTAGVKKPESDTPAPAPEAGGSPPPAAEPTPPASGDGNQPPGGGS